MALSSSTPREFFMRWRVLTYKRDHHQLRGLFMTTTRCEKPNNVPSSSSEGLRSDSLGQRYASDTCRVAGGAAQKDGART
jgi:hypothetical protein